MVTRFLICFSILSLLGCGGVTNYTDSGKTLMTENKYKQAIEEFDRSIALSSNPGQVCAAYYFRGDCHTKLGMYESAYADYYAARAMCCYLAQNQKSAEVVMGGTLVMSDCCLKFAPEQMKAVSGKLNAAQLEAAQKLARSRLDPKYLEN